MTRYVILIAFLVLPLTTCASAPKGELLVKVVDVSNTPISAAEVWVGGFKSKDDTLKRTKKKGVTDKEGEIKIYGELRDIEYGVNADKEGYYPSRKEVSVMSGDSEYEKETKIILRKKINPVPMYAKKVSVRLPETNKKFGFDFFEGGLVHEGEKGVDSDIYIKAERPVFKGPFDEFEQIVTISASSEKGGIMFFQPPESAKHSEFKSHHEAPESGYQEKVVVRSWRNPDEGVKFENRNRPAYVRIRTETDENGNIDIAHYCKIFPGFTPVGEEKAGVSFTYYCNPHPNDRGMEYKLKHSLVPGADEHNRPRVP